MKRIYLFLLLTFLYQQALSGQQLSFYNYTTENGLPTNSYEYVFQDSYGFIWLASFDGLFRWDGHTFEKYRYNEKGPGGLSSNIVYTIFEDSEKRLWVGTMGGLNLYDRQNDVFIKCKLRNDTQVPVNAILEDQHRRLWLGTSFGLCRYDYGKQQEQWFTDGNDVIFCLALDKENNIWAGTFNTGLKKFTQATGRFSRFTGQDFGSRISAILAPSDGNIWLGTERNGLFVIDLHGNVLQHFIKGKGSGKMIRCLYEDKAQTIWVGIMRGLLHYKRKGDQIPVPVQETAGQKGEQLYSITSVREDASGNTWFTSQHAGLFNTNRYKNVFKHYLAEPDGINGPGSNAINCFYEDKNGKIWMGSNGGGLVLFDPVNRSVQRPFSAVLGSTAINDIHASEEGIWLATWNKGLQLLDPLTGNITIYRHNPADTNSLVNDDIKSILPDDSLIWIGTHGDGLAAFHKKDRRFIHYRNNHSLPFDMHAPTWINHLFKDSRKRLWISTYSGVFVFDGRTLKQYNHSTDSMSISSNAINRVTEDASGNIWVVHESGMDQFDERSGTFIHFSDRYKLPAAIKNIFMDDDNMLWMSSNEGIAQFNPLSGELKKYDENDGLAVNAYQRAALRADNGMLYFGGARGFITFDPAAIQPLHLPAWFHFTDLYLFNERQIPGSKKSVLKRVLDYTDTLRLAYDQAFFSITFAAPDFYAPSRTQYSYLLEGLHNEWMEVKGSRQVSFTRLPAGVYTLRVRFTGAEGKWQPADKTLTIIVKGPWWQEWWFKSLAVLLLVSMLVLFFYLRMASVRKRNTLLKEEVRRQTKELQDMNVSLTEQRDEIKQQNENLEASNEEIVRKTDKILEQQQQIVTRNRALAQTVSELEKLNNTKDHFFSILAHDLKNPVAAQADIAGYLLENMRKMNMEELETYLKSIRNSSSAVFTLLLNLLNWSRTQADQLEPQPTGWNLGDMVSANARLMESQFRKKNILLNITVPADHVVFADYDMIDTAVRNILANSCKFTGYNGCVTVSSALDGNLITLCIADNGIGISAGQMEQLFRLNWKSVSQGTAGEKGIGLGLVIAKNFVEINNGSIEVDSEQGKGARFCLKLPAYNGPAIPPEERSLAAPVISDVWEDIPLDKLMKIRGKKILIVEDNEEVRAYLNLVLSGYFEIFEAENGAQGLKMALDPPPDVIITDLLMPGISGLQFCREVKSNPLTSHIPVIILTSQWEEEMKASGYEAGANVYLTKPVKKELLIQVVLNLLQQQEMQHGQLMNVDPSLTGADGEFLQQLIKLTESNMADPNFDARTICREMGISRTVLYAKIKALTGKSVHEFIRWVRLKKSVKLLLDGRMTVSQVSFEVGFNSHSYFDKCFVKEFGMGPKEYVANRRKTGF